MTSNEGESAAEERRRDQVRERYGKIASPAGCCSPASGSTEGCGGGASESCCGDGAVSIQVGYSPEELASLPEGANLGLGCGNPTALLSMKPGETVLDLGSGAGIDCFLAAQKVGAQGRVIGVDMTPGMIVKARENARKGGYSNVEFRLGEIEHLPTADRSVDVVVSNCVINLAPEKGQVYREAFRVLRPGGRFAVSDVVATCPITQRERDDPSLWSSCSSGALEVEEVKKLLHSAGFERIEVELRSRKSSTASLDGQASLGVVSADIRATKPS
ncbi:MAG TPA: arsenite methyltransferase, partial [Thermoplasmata archaeon]|nr:arsenite methyltransferase [Thermoplasmata archaeon]